MYSLGHAPLIRLTTFIIFLYTSLVFADPGLPYEQLPGQMQIEQSDKYRVPQVEFQTEPYFGATLLKEIDYRGEGQFPLEFARYNASPKRVMAEDCDYRAAMGIEWTHSYSSCLINHLGYGGSSSNLSTISVCTMGVCTLFGETLKPRSKDVRDTLIKNGSINGTTYRWVYMHFKSGIREAYDAKERLVARFDRSGIEHRVNYQAANSKVVSEVIHMPSGRRLIFQYNKGILASVTDPAGQVYTYSLKWITPDTVTFPAAVPAAAQLVRTYEEAELDCSYNGSIVSYYNTYLKTVTEAGQTLISTAFAWPCNSNKNPSYYKITRAGHNAKNLIQNRSYVIYSSPEKYKLTEQFADTDTANYKSFVNYRSFKNVNPSGNQIFRSSAVSARCDGCDSDYEGYTYNKSGDLLSRIDFLGHVTQFTNDSRGLPLTEVEAYGTQEARTTTRTWDTRFPLKTSEIRGEVAKEWRYNDRGHLVKEIVRPATEALVNDSCFAGSKTCHQTDYSYSYDPSTQVILQTVKTGPRLENGSTVTDYRSSGDLWKITDALNHTTTEVISTNEHGQITEQVDINGVHTVTAYNALRQPKSVSVGNDVTSYDYYTDGRLKTLTRPDNSQLSYTYTPAGSVKTVSRVHDGITETVEYQRDSRGKILQTLVSQSDDVQQTWTQTFDEKGLSATEADGSRSWSKALSYNANNLLERSCLSEEICELTAYDALEQVSDRSRAVVSDGALGPQIPLFSLDYDAAGRVDKVTDPLGLATALNNTEISKRSLESSPDFGNRQADYDLAGNATGRQDSDGNRANRSYDALDRLTRSDYSDGTVLTQIWDTPIAGDESHAANYSGRLSRRSRQNATATVTDDFQYNARGDIVATAQWIDNAGLTTTAGYGPDSRLDALTYPGGLALQYGYGNDGRIREVKALLGNTVLTLAYDIRYQPLLGRLRNLTFGNGLSYWRDRDAGGRLSAIRLLKPDQTLVYKNNVRYDVRSRVSGYGEYDFGYDDLDHLAQQTNVKSRQYSVLAHDNNGNLTRLENYDGNGALLRRNTLSYSDNRLSRETVTPTGSTFDYGYDLSGFVTGNGGYGYRYDAARTLTACSTATDTETYLYDGARRRVYKSNAAGQTRFVYDSADHLIYERSGNGSARNYVWLGDIPLAVIDQHSDGSLAAMYYIETDFANTPRYLRRASGDLDKAVWHWPLAPYGDTPALEDPDGDGGKVTFNLRYPGQYYDSFSGLHYNHTRYYSPRTGRYLQPDLIGLDGGTNVYTYANGNPVHYTDPTGTIWDFVDVGFFAQSLFNFFQQPSIDNAINAVLDGVGLLPGVPALGTIRQVGQATDKASDTVKITQLVTKPSLSAHKEALAKVHKEVGKQPKGEPGKFGSPQAGTAKKGYRLDPPHDGVAKGDAESKFHINWWDYSNGKKGNGGRNGAVSIEDYEN
ncbi:RHS repeat domain-containing protein [Methylomicrobium lacus]|uniref:RHS repeat domain-containing protein n=1 Tax=Methylomicrobium lacus TaxID=136992 RepID=UPI0004B7B1FC|nr:RHS repeat-associated core domain-containing protein [Methylomicrobium lacus]